MMLAFTDGPAREMRTSRRRFGVVLPASILGFLLGACTSPVPEIDRDTPGFSTISEEEISKLAQGRALYVSKCSGCHPLHPPSAGDAESWGEHIDDMAGRARIDSDQSNRILLYLEAASTLASP